MKKYSWPEKLKELQRHKHHGILNFLEKSHNLIHFVKQIFPANNIPQKIADSIEELEAHLYLIQERYDYTLDRVCNEIELLIAKGELK